MGKGQRVTSLATTENPSSEQHAIVLSSLSEIVWACRFLKHFSQRSFLSDHTTANE